MTKLLKSDFANFPTSAKVEADKARAVAKAASFEIGQRVKWKAAPIFGVVEAIDGIGVVVTFERPIDRTGELRKKLVARVLVAA